VCHHISTGVYCPPVRTALLPQVFQRNKLVSGVTTNFVRGWGGGGSKNSVEDRENGDLGAVDPQPGVLEAAVIW